MTPELQSPEKIETDEFKLPRGSYERYVAMRFLSRRWWILALPVAVSLGIAAALADVRWVIVALLFLFIITPGILSMAYFKYLLTPAARLNALRKKMTIVPGESIEITYFIPVPKNDGEEGENEKKEMFRTEEEKIEWADVNRVSLSAANYVIELRHESYPRFLIVPRKVLGGRRLPISY